MVKKRKENFWGTKIQLFSKKKVEGNDKLTVIRTVYYMSMIFFSCIIPQIFSQQVILDKYYHFLSTLKYCGYFTVESNHVYIKFLFYKNLNKQSLL